MRELILLALLLLIGAIFAIVSPDFLTSTNLLNMTRYFVEVGIISLPMTLIIISGGIDLSVGSTTALCAVVLGALWKRHLDLSLASCAVLVTGAALGAINGAAIAVARIPPLVTTLATMAFYRGVATGISGGEAVYFPERFTTLGLGEFHGIPHQLPILIALTISFIVFLSRTAVGRTIYALGANEAAARLSGIATERLKFFLYMLSGVMCGVASIILVARNAHAKAEGSAEGYELDAIAAVALGGTNIAGGEGGVIGTAVGLVIISALRRGLMLMGSGFPSEVQSVIIGVVLILTVWVDQCVRPVIIERRNARKQKGLSC